MPGEQAEILKALRIALRMEIDGKEYYLKISQESGNQLGRQLLQSLAAEEDMHRQKFEAIYQAIRQRKAWPVVTFPPERGKELSTIFAEASPKVGVWVEVPATELGAIEKAMEMENKSYDFYRSQCKKAIYDAERDFYQRIAAEESVHHQILLDYYEYLEDPVDYFFKKEHPSLDGG